MRRAHAMPFGAEMREGGVAFRLWAPAARSVALRLERAGMGETDELPMQAGERGWYALETRVAVAGDRYRFVIDGEIAVPDPASRFQPDDVHGPSELIDPAAFEWTDDDWRGRPWHETVLYELHVGTFTPDGTYAGAADRLDHLAALGVTAVELMPLSEAPGTRNWGYDGVLPFAPERHYGRPEALKAFVQAAHRHGLMVFLDVVYNHFGPEGNYLHRYAPAFFTDRHKTPWGAAIDFAGPDSRAVRDFFIHNALYWIEEFNVDGLRLDAVHAIYDESPRHFLAELAETVRARVPTERDVHLVLENDDNEARWLARDTRGRPLFYDAQWNDDFHHAVHVLATGETAGYYADYADAPPARLARTLTEGFAYQGEASAHRGSAVRGTPSVQLPPTAFVSFIQNHDQIGNRAMGERLSRLAPEEALRAAAALMLLAPMPPLLFMGEEWKAPHPFPFFCDFGPDLAEAVREGRRREFARFPAFADEAARARIPDPLDEQTFASAGLDWKLLEEPRHAAWHDLYRELLRIRHREIVPRLAGRIEAEGTREYTNPLTARWRFADGAVLSVIANMSSQLAPAPAPPRGRLLYATDSTAARHRPLDTLPPWFVAWFLDAPEARR